MNEQEKREKVIKELSDVYEQWQTDDYSENAGDYVAVAPWVIDYAIALLKAQPCEDAVSRNAVIDEINLVNSRGGFSDYSEYSNLFDFVDMLPSVQPVPVARVMAWREVIGAALECKPVYIEVKDSDDKEKGDDRWAMVTQYKDSITNGMIRAMSSYITSEILFAERYCKDWRCWTSRPTDEQREAVKW